MCTVRIHYNTIFVMRQGIVCFRTVRQIHRVRRVQNHENWDLQKNGSEDEIGVRSLFLTKLQLFAIMMQQRNDYPYHKNQ